ncbi:MAG: amino acid adenylation domain-containing protein [Anaerolineae bacterium]
MAAIEERLEIAEPLAEDEVYVFPVSFAQERLWFLDQFDPGSPYYNVPTAVRLSGALDAEAMGAALALIVSRHEALRTTFTSFEGVPQQVVHAEMAVALPLVELSHLSGERALAEALRLAQESASEPFDLSRGPLLRAVLYRLGVRDHVLALCAHHIVCDGWSTAVIVEELAAAYRAYSRGEEPRLAALPIQYGDYAVWQRQHLSGEGLASLTDYWTGQLAGLPPTLELPTDYPRPARQSSRGGNVRATIDAALTTRLRQVGREHGATLFMTLLAGFGALLGRYSGTADVAIGSPIANRTRSEVEGLIGFFVNTLVLRQDLSGDPTFAELLERTRRVCLEAYAHQDMPFETLVEALQPERDMSRSTLFQVMLILQNAPASRELLPGISATMLDLGTDTSTCDLTFNASEHSDGLDVAVEYSTDLFTAGTVRRMLRHYVSLLAAAVAQPATPLSRLSYMGAEEQAQLRAWNDTSRPYPVGCTFPRLVEARAAARPAAAAVSWAGEDLSYADLLTQAASLAGRLGAAGVTRGDTVAVCLERSPRLIVAMLAVMRCGAAFLALDPTHPEVRLATVLADSGARLVIADEGTAASLPAARPPLLLLDGAVAARGVPAADLTADVASTAGDTAYVIYTSGSTGRPKGVAITHAALENAWWAWRAAYDLVPEDVHLQMAGATFDVFVGDVVRALCSGARLVLCPREVLLEPQALYRLIAGSGATVAEFVPAVLRPLMRYVEEHGLRLDGIRLAVCGSDTWTCGEYRRWRRAISPSARLVNSYGVTEATIDSCYYDGADLPETAERPLPIGRPFANTTLHVLDAAGRPVPVGVTGELHIGGAGLASGYLNQPELTASRFVTHALGGVRSERLYATGDMARFRPDGTVELAGRADNQVKVRGFRIELGDVESALALEPSLSQAAVRALPNLRGEPSLVAYYVSRDGARPTAAGLRRYLQERLPEYMTPAAFVPLEAMPLTASGKVDRRALPEPDWSQVVADDEYVAPRTPTEELLTGIWAQVLGLPRVGVYDSFFSLGGHSLLATQVVSRLRDVLGVDVPLRAIFEAPSVAAFAERLAVVTVRGEEAPPLAPVARDGALPLSFGQQRLWFLDQLEPGSPFYNIPSAVRLRGPLDARLLQRALLEVVRRHEVLRTTFATVDGQPHLRVAAEPDLRLSVVDLSALPDGEREAEARRMVAEDSRRPFDLAAGPLLRATVMRLGDDDHVALFTMHHIVGDDWSTNVLIQEVAGLYDAFSHGHASPLRPLPVQYADYASWQRRWLQGDTLERQLTYWREQLAGAPAVLELPFDRPRPPVQTPNGGYLTFYLPATLSQDLAELCRRHDCTLFMTLLAAFQALLHRYSGQADICVGSPIANRTARDVEPLIGFFANTLVFRADLGADPSFAELLARTREACLGAYAHQDLPFEMLVDDLQIERSLSHSPLFQVMFALQNAPHSAMRLADLTVEPLEAHSGSAKFDLTLFMAEAGGRLGGALEYNADLFDAATVARMLRHFEALLTAAVGDPERSVSRLPLLGEHERRVLLQEWNDADTAWPQPFPAHEMIARQARRTPEAVAVSLGQRRMTYAELDRRGNQLAQRLRSLGVGADVLVGLCLRRSPELLVGLLAVLKAGGAYVPLDPTYPPERIAYMLRDSGAPVVLTESSLRQALPDTAARILCLDTDWPEIAGESIEAPDVPVDPDDLAYVIYTSGSTGQPKGAMIRHRGLTNYLTWCERAYPLADGAGSPVQSSVSFDLTVTSLLSPLLAGREVALVPEDEGIEALSGLLQHRSGFSLIKITPAHMQLLAQQLTPEQARGSAKAFIIGGENLLGEVLSFWQDNSPGTVHVNEYGPTETVVGCCIYSVADSEHRVGSVPIGRPIANTRMYVLDRHEEPVPIGVAGELYIGGEGVGRGYLNRPDLSAERFLPDPFRPGGTMYRTGDIGRYLPDGNIVYLGRADQQLKIRGFRIEPAEVEATLRRHDAVADALVLAREDTPGDKRLVAYVIARGRRPGPQELRDYLGRHLPGYMVPAAIVVLDAFPLSPNGKVERRALPAPDAAAVATSGYVAPTGEAEVLLAGIFATLLGVERVSAGDNFFALGGDSILTIQVVARARQAGLDLSAKHLFQAKTVADLARLATASGHTPRQAAAPFVGEAPLNPIQHWFLERRLTHRDHYNQALLLELAEPLDQTLLRRAVTALMERHDALRTRLIDEASPRQSVAAPDSVEPPVEWLDVSAVDDEHLAATIESEATRLQGSLSLASGPVFHLGYFDRGTRPHRLLLALHHFAVDAVSWTVLLPDLLDAYDSLRRGGAANLAAAASPARWAKGLADYAATEAASAELQYWLAASAPAAPLPADAERDADASTERFGESASASLDPTRTTALLQEANTAYSTNPQDLLLAALAETLCRWAGADTVVVDVEGHGRQPLASDEDLSRAVGWFTALYPVRLSLPRPLDPAALLTATKESLRAVPNNGVGYGVLRYLHPDDDTRRRLSAVPSPQVVFNYFGQLSGAAAGMTAFHLASEPIGPQSHPDNSRSHDLEVSAGIVGASLQVTFSYSSRLHRRDTVAALAEGFVDSLARLIDHCLSPNAGARTLSDFKVFGWDQADIDAIAAEIARQT